MGFYERRDSVAYNLSKFPSHSFFVLIFTTFSTADTNLRLQIYEQDVCNCAAKKNTLKISKYAFYKKWLFCRIKLLLKPNLFVSLSVSMFYKASSNV